MRLVVLALLLCQNGEAFVSKSVTNRNLDIRSPITRVEMFFAEESSPPKAPVTDSKTIEKAPAAVDLVSSDDERFINMAGSFLVDNFWLNSQHHKIEGEISAEARMNLVVEQCSDLQDKYGEIMGKRLTNSCIIGALNPDSRDMVGVATIKSTLLMNGIVLESEKSESIAKNAIASLAPKERREYKNSSLITIADELLPPDSKAIVVLSNLAISGEVRKQGVAQKICEEAETIAQSWGYSDMWLVVESENTAARKLYEDKLGYKVAFRNDGETALRANIDDGSFDEVQADTLIMVKTI
jgi:ribosomal protein S18 acetylase RimI-like enzyme